MARPSRGLEVGILLLMWQALYAGLQTFPPVTLSVIALQVNILDQIKIVFMFVYFQTNLNLFR